MPVWPLSSSSELQDLAVSFDWSWRKQFITAESVSLSLPPETFIVQPYRRVGPGEGGGDATRMMPKAIKVCQLDCCCSMITCFTVRVSKVIKKMNIINNAQYWVESSLFPLTDNFSPSSICCLSSPRGRGLSRDHQNSLWWCNIITPVCPGPECCVQLTSAIPCSEMFKPPQPAILSVVEQQLSSELLLNDSALRPISKAEPRKLIFTTSVHNLISSISILRL